MPYRFSIAFTPFALCLAGAALADTATAPVIITGFSHPESVLIGPSARYVSNIGDELDPLAKDGDGFISIVDAEGAITDLQAFTGLNAPKGMALLDGTLYVADIDRIVGFDLQSGQRSFAVQIDCAQACMLNDVAVAGERLLISDTLRGQLYGLDPKVEGFTLLAEGIPGANGIVWDDTREEAMIVALGADFGGGHVFTWAEAEGLSQIPDSPFGVFDGVAMLPDGRLLVSDWVSLTPQPGVMRSVDPVTGAASEVRLEVPIQGPADFALDEESNTLWIPATLDGAVVVLPAPGR